MPFSDTQLQTLKMTADFTGLSKSYTSQSFRELVKAAEMVRVTAPQVVPNNLPGGQALVEMEGGQIMKTNA